MDQLKAENERLVEGYEKCLKMNQLLIKFRLYFKDYLKFCKCKQSAEQSLIRSKTERLEEEFAKVTSVQYVIKQEVQRPVEPFVQNLQEDMDIRSDGITEDQNSSLDATDYEIQEPEPNVVITTDVYICERVDCNERFNSKDALELHSQICPKESSKQFKCSECADGFDELTKLKAHHAIHRQSVTQLNGTQQMFLCPVEGCNKEFEKVCGLNTHITKMHKNIEVIPELKKPFVCDWVGCEHKTSSKQDLDLHIKRKHTLEKPFKCDKCDKRFELEKILRHHQKSHSNLRHKCDFEGCEYKTPHIWELKAHIKHKHLSHERFVCEYEGCDRNYKYEGDLKVHIKNVHENQTIFHCEWPGCQSTFQKKMYLRNHLLRHKNERKFKCEVEECAKTFNTQTGLRNHRAVHRGRTHNHPCNWPGCTQMFATPMAVKNHTNSTHLMMRPFVCEGCGKAFTRKECRKAHQKLHCSGFVQKVKKEHKCDECPRVFSMAKNLKNHKIAIHSTELLFVCEWPECGERFKTSHSLTYHRTTHTNTGEYKCCAINCGRSFMNRETLLHHESVHDKKFACSWPGCGKKFQKNFLLRDHTRRHQNIREFKCSVEGCGQSFFTKMNLNHHVDKHTNPTPFKCEEEGCDRTFSHKSSLRNHLLKVHGKEM